MRDCVYRLDRVPCFVEIDPEGVRERWRGRGGAHVRSCNQSSSLSSATGFQSMGGFSGASPYRRSASVVPSPSRRFAWRRAAFVRTRARWISRSEEHTSELQSLMRISYAVFCLKKKNYTQPYQ